MHSFPSHLLKGYSGFLDSRYAGERDNYRRLAGGQTPTTMIIACCDSRAAPETIFNAGPGELFVLRNVANLVPPYGPDGDYHSTSAAVEFAVQSLGIAHIVVMGHGRCGGISAALEPGEPLSDSDFIGKWMSLLGPLPRQLDADALMTRGERQTALERISIRRSVEALRSFPYVAEKEAAGTLSLHGAWFDIGLGELWVMDGESGDFARPDLPPAA